jgi:hypothetical protein
VQFVYEKRKPCYGFSSRQTEPRIGLATGREKDRDMSALDVSRTTSEASGEGGKFFYFRLQPFEKSRFHQIKPSKSKDFLLGFIWICLQETRAQVRLFHAAGRYGCADQAQTNRASLGARRVLLHFLVRI